MTASTTDGEWLAATVERVLSPLNVHLSAEEAAVLPLIDAHLSAAEWAEVGQKGLSSIEPDVVPVLFGMLLLEATAEQRQLLAETVPEELFTLMSQVGPSAYQAHKSALRPPA